MRYLRRMTLCVAIAVLLALVTPAAWAQSLNGDLLQKGMSLNDVVQAFGQPAQIEWVNLSGTPILFVFYPADRSDAIVRQDGLTLLPLGFVTEALAGWGKDFYEQSRSTPKPAVPANP